ncbi:MAG: 2-amino-4-hydroxy-6-hydroxymethyldihydropteridine diphosphokinase [Anaerolineae bacterium]
MTRVYVLLGSNLDAERNLQRAVSLLAEQLTIVGVSPVYESTPVGYSEQPCFLNAAVAIETELNPSRLKNGVLRPVEAALGRVRTRNKSGPRTIDLDIVLYGDRVLVCGGKRIPDPDLDRRAHVALPMAALAPGLRHPETGETMLAIAGRLGPDSINLRSDIKITLRTRELEGD